MVQVIHNNTAWMIHGAAYIVEPSTPPPKGWSAISRLALMGVRLPKERLWHPSHTSGEIHEMSPPVAENHEWCIMRVNNVPDTVLRKFSATSIPSSQMLNNAAGYLDDGWLRRGVGGERSRSANEALCAVRHVQEYDRCTPPVVQPPANAPTRAMTAMIMTHRSCIVTSREQALLRVFSIQCVGEQLRITGRVLGCSGFSPNTQLMTHASNVRLTTTEERAQIDAAWEKHKAAEQATAHQASAHWDPYQ